VTFLFTDLEGSTRLWEEHSDAMRAALARHDEILRDAVEGHAGHVVKTTGDGLHAVFATAHDAVVAAVVAQRALGGEPWPLPEPFRVRIGVHTGEAEIRDGDYYGSAVNRAARVSAAAHGGQIVVSHATEEVARDHLDGVDVVDLGEHLLRDLARPERIFQVRAEGLAHEFPPLRTLDTLPGNVPRQATTFVGREDDISGVAKTLREVSLVTITGVGGVGKTRLAVEVAAELQPHQRDGSWIVELAAADSDEAFVQVVAATLGIAARPAMSLEDSVVESLSGRSMLLVLDNCEHLLDAAGLLAERLLRDCPDVRVLATSREGLAVPGERVWPLRSLSVPRDTDPGSLAASAAIMLFVDRASAARPGFRLDESNAAAVAEVCRRLDGIPLALELAAARVVAMSPAEIAGHLDERFRLLTGGRRTAVERHQTLRATVDWSYSHLSEIERSVFDRLGVFSATFDAAAATAVAGDNLDVWDVLDALTDLVAKSMVVVADEGEGEAGATRYQLLETLRHFAREQLDGSGAADDVRRRHAEHFARVAEEAARELETAQEIERRARLHLELDDLRSAVTWGLERDVADDAELSLRILTALANESVLRRSNGIGTWAIGAVDHARRSTPAYITSVLAAAAWALIWRGEYEEGLALAREALDQPDLESAPGVAGAFSAEAVVLQNRGQFDAAVALYERSQAVIEASGRSGSMTDSTTWSSRAIVHAAQGDYAQAREDNEHALRVARAIQNPTALAQALFAEGLARWPDDPEAGLAAFEESARLMRSGACDATLDSALSRVSELRAEAGDRAGALDALGDALHHSVEVTGRMGLSYTTGFSLRTFAVLGAMQAAATVAGAVDHGALPVASIWEGKDTEFAALARERIAAVLTPAEIDACEQRGASMTEDQVVAFIRAEIIRLQQELDEAHA
jgi:predicted ATPase/class 3 adenylate cyclase